MWPVDKQQFRAESTRTRMSLLVIMLLAQANAPAGSAPSRSLPSPSTVDEDVDLEPLVPFYVPRRAALGLMINSPVVTPLVRLTWEADLYQRPRNHIVLLLEVGTGVGANFVFPMRALYQHVGLFGAGYRSTRPRWHWAFQLTIGGLWYRAGYAPNMGYQLESRVLPYSEGRVEVGVRIKAHFILGAFGGYGAPWFVNTLAPGTIYVGGPMFGLFSSWR